MKSRVHPKYKTQYRVSNWPDYDQSLVQGGDLTIWISADAIAAWVPDHTGQRGGQRRYSDLAIETALVLRLVFHLPLRQAEGFLRSVLEMMELDLDAPDHTTLSRRSRRLNVELRPAGSRRGRHLIVDSTGLSIVGQGEWAAAKHGGKGIRGWKKLHLGVDECGMIVAEQLTDSGADDAATAPQLLDQIDGRIRRIVADGAYDERSIYEAGKANRAVVVVPPSEKAVRARQLSAPHPARDRVVAHVRRIGLRNWKKRRGWHQQARVENTMYRYKRIIGSALRARHPDGQGVEARLACSILNRMTAMGRPERGWDRYPPDPGTRGRGRSRGRHTPGPALGAAGHAPGSRGSARGGRRCCP